MPHSKSAEKRLRTDAIKRVRNKSCKSALKTYEKKFRAATSSADGDQAADLIKKCFSKLDKAAKKGIIHKNKANNKKSQLSAELNKIAGKA